MKHVDIYPFIYCVSYGQCPCILGENNSLQVRLCSVGLNRISVFEPLVVGIDQFFSNRFILADKDTD